MTLPNLDNLPAASLVDIWFQAQGSGQWSVVGTGQVSAGGTLIEAAGITGGGFVFAVPPSPSLVASADHNDFNHRPTALADGNFSTRHDLVGTRSLGRDRSVRLIYNSTAADPRPIVAADLTFAAGAPLPGLLEGRLDVGGVAVAGPVFTSTGIAEDPADPGLQPGQTIRQALQFDAAALATGSTPYRTTATAKYDCSRVGALVAGNVAVNNEDASPFGAGWSIDGLARLHLAGASPVLTAGDGSIMRFTPQADGELFGPPADFGSFASPLAHAVADLDGDLDLDLAVPDGATGKVFLLLGDGAGGFVQAGSVQAGAPASGGFSDTVSVATGDFNADLVPDLVAAKQLSGKVSVFIGTGGGAYQAPLQLSATLAQSAGVGDFNQDGNDDIAVARTIGSSFRIRVFFGNGLGGFFASLDFPAASAPTSLIVDDFNNDGRPDIAVAAVTANRVSVLLNTGGTGFSTASYAAGQISDFTGMWALAAADFDGDGIRDLVVANGGAATVSVLLNNGAGGFLARALGPDLRRAGHAGGDP